MDEVILKMIGSGLILVASFGLAMCVQREMKEHLKCLFELRNILYEIFWEMNFSLQPVEMVLLYQVQTNHFRIREILTEIGEKLKGKSDGLGEDADMEPLTGDQFRIFVGKDGITTGSRLKQAAARIVADMK